MLCLSIKVNGKHCCTIGFEEACDYEERGSVLNVIVSANHGSPDLRAGGLNSKTNEHALWKVPKIEVGDSVTIDVIESDVVDPPSELHPVKPRPGN